MSLRRQTKILFLLGILSVFTLVAYVNCSDGGVTGNDSLGLDDTLLGDPNALSINVNAADPLIIGMNDVSFNVGGFCDVGGGVQTRVHWRLSDLNFINSVDSGNSFGECIGQRFSLFVPIPSGYNYNLPHVLEIDMESINIDGDLIGVAKTSIGVIAQ